MLTQLQEQLAKHIQNPGVTADRMNEVITSSCNTSDMEELAARLAVYQNNVYAALVDVLQDTFPTIYTLTGDAFFTLLAREYILNHPPASPLLFAYGERFPDFVKAFPSLSNFAYMPDVATLDWMRHNAYYAANKSPLGAQDFVQFNPQQLSEATLNLHPSSHILVSSYAVFSIWESNQQQTPETQITEKLNADSAENVLVYRTDQGVQTLHISAAIAVFLKMLKQNRSVADAMEAAMNTDISDNDEFNPSSAFQFLIDSGLCTDIIPAKQTAL